MTARHPLGPEQIFAGRYRIERLLAEGGMGAVFVAEHQGTEQRVALKVLWPHVLASPSAVATFQFEAKVASRVSSENIVRVIDAGSGSVPFFQPAYWRLASPAASVGQSAT